MKYDPTLTAIGNTKETNSARMLCAYSEKPIRNILDYGCGKLRNSNFLKGKGFNVFVFDLPSQLSKLDTSEFTVVGTITENTFDAVLCSFVLNVVEQDTRKQILSNIHKTLVAGGLAFIEVRKTITAKHMEAYKDGFLVGKNTVKTFQKVFTKNEIVALLEGLNFTVEQVEQKPHAISVVVRKSR